MRMIESVHRQQGATLISLLVGMLISLLTIAAMLATYKVAVEVSGSASRDAARDGQVASGILTAQLELQQAGYKIDISQMPAAGGSFPDNRNLYYADGFVAWRHGGGCKALKVETPQGAAAPALYISADVACTTAKDVPASTWVWEPLTDIDAKPWKDRSGIGVAASAGGQTLSSAAFRVDGNCSLPYAQQAGLEEHSPELVLETGSGGAKRTLFRVCLSNLVTQPATT